MIGELIPTGVTFGVGRVSLNTQFSGTADFNNVEIFGNLSAGTGGAIYSGGTDLYNIFGGNNTTASNGLTKTGDNITLGGLMTGNTILDASSSATLLLSGDTNNANQIKIESNFVSNEPAYLRVGKGQAYLQSDSGTTLIAFLGTASGEVSIKLEDGINSKGFEITNTNFEIQDGIDNVGINYQSNYHAGYTNRTLVDKEYVDNVVASASTGGGGVEAYVNAGSGSTITWNVSGDSTNYEITLTANTFLNFTNVRNGEYGTIIVNQDGVGGRTITLGTVNGLGGTHKVVNGGGGSPTLTSTASAIDVLSFTYNGTTMFWTVGNDYT